jgi:outer membrane protein OmpA-like peptidoglycan-associated protein
MTTRSHLGAIALAGALGLAALAEPAGAQPFQGVYLGGGVGYNLPQDITVTTPVPTSPRTRAVTEGGIVGLGSIGYGFGNGLRLEVEGNYRGIGMNGTTGGLTAPGGGSLRTYGIMANALFDMDVGSPWVYPYLGGGLGYAWTTADNVTVTSGGVTTTSNSTNGRFAVQAIAGLSFPMPGVPGLSLTTEYRFFGVLGETTSTGVTSPGGIVTSVKTQDQYNHSFLLGVRYAFGVTPPPAPVAAPAPAAQPARSYLVFFDWDKATLTDRARAIIKEAADNSRKVQVTRIEVNGYTDTSGTKQYNQALSVRRAEAVAAELVRNDVPRANIAIQGFGDTKLLVPTGTNVREPQNRRVEIIIR